MGKMWQMVTAIIVIVLAQGCSTTYPNQDVSGKVFPSVTGTTLTKQQKVLPDAFAGEFHVVLIGYVQDSQFDIDRWLIGLDMTQTALSVYELPTIQGMIPRMFQTVIDDGMRKGIPKDLWKGVITIYKDGEQIQQFTGNQSPRNARVMLLTSTGEIAYFYDDGFSVNALNALRQRHQQLTQP